MARGADEPWSVKRCGGLRGRRGTSHSGRRAGASARGARARSGVGRGRGGAIRASRTEEGPDDEPQPDSGCFADCSETVCTSIAGTGRSCQSGASGPNPQTSTPTTTAGGPHIFCSPFDYRSPANMSCATPPPLAQPEVTLSPFGTAMSSAPSTPHSVGSTMSRFESGSEIWPKLLFKSKKARFPARTPTTTSAAASVSPYMDDFREAVSIVSSSDPVTLEAIPSTSSGVGAGMSSFSRQVFRLDGNSLGTMEFIDQVDCSHLSSSAMRALYGSNNESNDDCEDIYERTADESSQRMAEAENDDYLTPDLVDLANRVKAFEDDGVEAVNPAALGSSLGAMTSPSS